MAELAAGAVSSLLGVIRNEALLLGRVRHDVQFIQEEMESMKSFLTHLARRAPGSGEHDEQIRTWMNQVRLLAQDSNNCIDLYLYRGNPEIHRARGSIRRYVWWLPWFLHKMVAQHRAAIQLRALKDRARDIGERRLRYGVEVPVKGLATGQSTIDTGLPEAARLSLLAHVATTSAASGDEDEDSDSQIIVPMESADHSGSRGAFFEPRTPLDNVRVKLADWIKNVAQRNASMEESIPSVAIVAPDNKETQDIAMKALDLGKEAHFTHSVLVDIPAVHFYHRALRPLDILYYILRELQSNESKPQQDIGKFIMGEDRERAIKKIKNDISSEKEKRVYDIRKSIQQKNIDKKISEIKEKVKEMKGGRPHLDHLDQINEYEKDLLESAKDEPLGILLRALWLIQINPAEGAYSSKKGLERKETTYSHKDIIKETSKKLREHMEKEVVTNPEPKENSMKDDVVEKLQPMEEKAQPKPIRLTEAHYENLLQEVFPGPVRKTMQIPKKDSNQAPTFTATGTIILVEDQFKEMIRKVLQELQEEKFVKQKIDNDGLQQETSTKPAAQEDNSLKLKPDTVANGKPGQDRIPDGLIEETMDKIIEIEWGIQEQLVIKGITDEIIASSKREDARLLVILKLDHDYVSGWEETKTAFSMLGCIGGALMLTTEVNASRSREYCCPGWEPIDYSLLGLYRDIVLEITNKINNEGSSSQIFLDILDKCKEYEVCMKIFVHALYANPKRSNEDLTKLNRTLQFSENSVDHIAQKMLKFSYSDLPKDYKSCLLFLAIFPQRQRIRRSTLIGRWVVEGLITKEDWQSSVRRANRCFDTLIDRWLVYPADIGATGKVKSCIIGDLVHGFITKIARKQRIVETRLSHHLARHFSIFNDLRLRGSDTIDKFFKKISEESYQLSLIKVLDLEGCKCFGGKNQRYMKDICRKMLLLKYLGLRGSNVTHLPSEINNLRELEVLDIRHTNVSVSATVNVLLLKLKRLLAGSSAPGSTAPSCVMIPEKIEKMLNMEVLSNVKPRRSHDLKDIGKLWQLRKLGVVIENKDSHLMNLFQAISNLHECLRDLSITLHSSEQDPSNQDSPREVVSGMANSPKLLESLSISGTTQKGQLLRLLAKDSDKLLLAKVTLTKTGLKQDGLEVLAKLPNLVCFRLRREAYIDSKLTFKKVEFQNLKYFLVEGSNITVITFEDGAAPKLETIVLCSTEFLESLPGVENLPKLKEIELNNSNKISLFVKAEKISKVTMCGSILTQEELNILAKIPNMRCLVMKEKSYVHSQLIFNKDEFPRLNLLIVDFSIITKISFNEGSAPKLEKIVLSFAKDTLNTLSGIENLPKLKELEFNGQFIPEEVHQAITKNKNKLRFIHNKPENQDPEVETILEKTNAARFPFCWKN
uniref:Uncharacterized protein n=1 Tax=Avena sativa TaxID=4498 RepID=A0ACD6AM13_AVESA